MKSLFKTLSTGIFKKCIAILLLLFLLAVPVCAFGSSSHQQIPKEETQLTPEQFEMFERDLYELDREVSLLIVE